MDVDLKVNNNADEGLRTAQDDRKENGVDQEETDHIPQAIPHTKVRKAYTEAREAHTEPSEAHTAVRKARSSGVTDATSGEQVELRRYKSAGNNVPVEEVERVEELGNYLSTIYVGHNVYKRLKASMKVLIGRIRYYLNYFNITTNLYYHII